MNLGGNLIEFLGKGSLVGLTVLIVNIGIIYGIQKLPPFQSASLISTSVLFSIFLSSIENETKLNFASIIISVFYYLFDHIY